MERYVGYVRLKCQYLTSFRQLRLTSIFGIYQNVQLLEDHDFEIFVHCSFFVEFLYRTRVKIRSPKINAAGPP